MKGSTRFIPLVLLLVWSSPAGANKVTRIGALVTEDFFLPSFEGFKEKMKEKGYVDGKNVQYYVRNAKGDQKALQKLALELVQQKPDLIVTSSGRATLPVVKATQGSPTPVVFLGVGNPLEFVKGYASSGNNLTGISTSVFDLTEKRLELLKELAPSVKRVASINNPQGLNYEENLLAVRQAAKKLGMELWEINVGDKNEMEQIAPTVTRKLADAVFVAPDRVLRESMALLVKQSIKEKLPLIPPPAAYNSGGLATYGHDYLALGRQGANLADKILKGAKPSDLPIEQPDKLKLVINLNTAKAIGLKIPKEVLLRADEVIE
jgi:putative ABC transport system substrate-binding protein